MVNTPVLYITFARPEYASQSFAAIKKAQPQKLYFYSNKARENKPDEVRRNEEVRSFIKQIDWDCEVKTWLRDEYVDVFTSIKGAIDWVFDNEEETIVIEEDVVAGPAFFDYMDKMVVKYKDDERIWIISGNNGAPQYSPKGVNYFPTRIVDIYGWASWRRVWQKVDWQMDEWNTKDAHKKLRNYMGSYIMYLYNKVHYDNFYKQIKKSTFKPWDYLFSFSMRMRQGYCITPYTNLAKDIGLLGENHLQGIASPLSFIDFESDRFEVNDDCRLELSAFDWKYFSRVRFPDLIKRRLKRLFDY